MEVKNLLNYVRILSKLLQNQDKLLDPLAGVGGSLLGAALCGRKAIGIEINQEWVNI